MNHHGLSQLTCLRDTCKILSIQNSNFILFDVHLPQHNHFLPSMDSLHRYWAPEHDVMPSEVLHTIYV